MLYPEPASGEEAAAAVGDAYDRITGVVSGLTEEESLLATRCTGWTVADLLFHQLLDAQRALIAMASPSGAEPDVDFVSYWKPFQPGSEGYLEHARYVRLAATAITATSTGGFGDLVDRWRLTSRAAARAVAAGADQVITTQGHVLAAADFAATLVTESAVHHLDMIVELPAADRPAGSPLVIACRTLDGLLGATAADLPADTWPGWDDATYLLKGTGRIPLTEDEQARLGGLAKRFPLLG